MSPPPLPYSLSMVMSRMSAIALSHGGLASPTRLIPLEEERQQEHNRGSPSKNRERIDVRQRSRLSDRRPISSSKGLVEGKRAIQARCRQVSGQHSNALQKSWVPRRDVRSQVSLVDLRSAGNEGRHHGSADTASDVAHEVQQSGYAVAFFRRHSHIGNQGDRDKQKPEANHLDDSQHARMAKADLKIQRSGRVKHGERKRQPANGDEITRLDLAGQRSYHRHKEEQQESSSGEDQTRQGRGVSQQGLEELRNHHQSSKQQ